MSQGIPGPAGPQAAPVIDWGEFRGIVRASFFTVKRALATERAEICRHVMTEDAWQRVRAEVEVLRHDRCANLQRGIDITEIKAGDRDVAGTLDRVTARLMVSGVDCVVNLDTRQVVSGHRWRDDWLEDWTFERSRDPGLLNAARAARCPACGGPLKIDSDGQCSFCGASVPGAKTDWLVAAIARPSESELDPHMNMRATLEASKVVVDAMAAQAAENPWLGRDPAGPPASEAAAAGIIAIRQRDAAFNASDLVVEAREVFLKLEESRNELRPAEVRPMVSDEVYAAEVARVRQAQETSRRELRSYLDIKGVTVVDAGTAGGRDRLVTRISAVSARSVVDTNTGALLEGSALVHPWSEDLAFERDSTAVTNALTGLLAHRCPACAAPADVTEDGRCVYCARHVTGGEKDWILVAVTPVVDPTAAQA